MGKTKTAFVTGITEEATSGAEKYKLKQQKKAAILAGEPPEKPIVEKVESTAEPIEKREFKEKPEQKKEKEGIKKVHIAGLKGGQRIKIIEPELTEPEVESVEGAEISKKAKKIKVRSKKYKESRAKVDKNKLYSFSDAIKLIRQLAYAKFDETVELHLTCKKGNVNENITLPFPFGKKKTIEVANEKTIEKLALGKIDFDILLSTPEYMPKLVPFAKLLGPRGLMPNPKNKTLIKDVKDAEKFPTNSINLKSEREKSIIHTVTGKLSQKDNEIEENMKTILESIGLKMITKAYIKSTMSPSVKLSI